MKLLLAILIIILIAGCVESSDVYIPEIRYICPDGSIAENMNSCSEGIRNQTKINPKDACESNGFIWCNENCYSPCPDDKEFDCSAEPRCIPKLDVSDIKNSIVLVSNRIIGCCDSFNQISSALGRSGSGIIFSRAGSNFYVLTSRHVIDCIFEGTCLYPNSENITVTTQSGKAYKPTKVFYASNNLDLVILEFQTEDYVKPVKLNSRNYSIGEKVTVMGYPDLNARITDPILDFSGKIVSIYNITTYNELSFFGMQTEALALHAPSGGGLFNKEGELIGIVSWENKDQKVKTIIDVKALADIISAKEKFLSCTNKTYKNSGETCCFYGTIFSSDEKCYSPCGLPNNYCLSPNICCNGLCHEPCGTGYYLAENCGCIRYSYYGY